MDLSGFLFLAPPKRILRSILSRKDLPDSRPFGKLSEFHKVFKTVSYIVSYMSGFVGCSARKPVRAFQLRLLSFYQLMTLLQKGKKILTQRRKAAKTRFF